MIKKSLKSKYKSEVVFLIGYMASGKTTLSRAVSALTGIRTIDLDEEIERRSGMTIPAFFAAYGEPEFRALETATLAEIISNREPVIIACGGGTACKEANMSLMNLAGTTVWLDASEDAIVARLMQSRQHRPLLKDLSDEQLREKVRTMLAERRPYYRRAHKVFATTRLDTAEQVASAARRFIKRFFLID